MATEALRRKIRDIAHIALVRSVLPGGKNSLTMSLQRRKHGVRRVLKLDDGCSLTFALRRDGVQVVLARLDFPRHRHVWVVHVAASFGEPAQDVLHELDRAGGVVVGDADARALAWESVVLVSSFWKEWEEITHLSRRGGRRRANAACRLGRCSCRL
jgi:hypothetical protein